MDDNNISLAESRANTQREQHLFNLVELSINSLVKTIEVLAKSGNTNNNNNNNNEKQIEGLLTFPSSTTNNPPNPFFPPFGSTGGGGGGGGGIGTGGGLFPSNPFGGMSKEDKELMSSMIKLIPDMQKQVEKRDKEEREWKEKVFKKDEE